MSHARVEGANGGVRAGWVWGDGGTVASMRLRRRRQQEGHGFRYSAWDGTQKGFDLDADALLDEMTDDLLYHGDLHAALRRLMQQGMQDRNDEQLMGLREMLQRLREQRREMLDRYDLGGVYEEIAEQLREVVEQEREGIEHRVDDANASNDKRRQEIVEDLAKQRREELDQLPPDLAGKVNALQQYDWMDDAARQRFEELMEKLKEQLLQSTFNQMSEGMQNMDPERMARMKDMLAELNQMLEQREQGDRARLRRLHGALRRLLPRQPADASTSCSSRWRSRWRRCSSS